MSCSLDVVAEVLDFSQPFVGWNKGNNSLIVNDNLMKSKDKYIVKTVLFLLDLYLSTVIILVLYILVPQQCKDAKTEKRYVQCTRSTDMVFFLNQNPGSQGQIHGDPIQNSSIPLIFKGYFAFITFDIKHGYEIFYSISQKGSCFFATDNRKRSVSVSF